MWPTCVCTSRATRVHLWSVEKSRKSDPHLLLQRMARMGPRTKLSISQKMLWLGSSHHSILCALGPRTCGSPETMGLRKSQLNPRPQVSPRGFLHFPSSPGTLSHLNILGSQAIPGLPGALCKPSLLCDPHRDHPWSPGP